MKRLVAAVLVFAPISVFSASPRKSDRIVRFVVRVENVSTPRTLKLSTGDSAPAPNSPVVWAVHRYPGVFFTPGHFDHGVGLEALAEDGNPEPLAQHLAAGGEKGVVTSGFSAIPIGDDKPGPATPGKYFEFAFDARPGDRLSFATMFGQSNDLWMGTDENGLALFDERARPVVGNITAQLGMWDAGTEQNEEPGIGPNQAPRQKAPNTGSELRQKIGPVSDEFHYPALGEVLKVTVSVQPMTAQKNGTR